MKMVGDFPASASKSPYSAPPVQHAADFQGDVEELGASGSNDHHSISLTVYNLPAS